MSKKSIKVTKNLTTIVVIACIVSVICSGGLAFKRGINLIDFGYNMPATSPSRIGLDEITDDMRYLDNVEGEVLLYSFTGHFGWCTNTYGKVVLDTGEIYTYAYDKSDEDRTIKNSLVEHIGKMKKSDLNKIKKLSKNVNNNTLTYLYTAGYDMGCDRIEVINNDERVILSETGGSIEVNMSLSSYRILSIVNKYGFENYIKKALTDICITEIVNLIPQYIGIHYSVEGFK